MDDGGIQRDERRSRRGIAYPSRLMRRGEARWLMDVSGRAEPVELATTAAQRLRGMLFRDPDEVAMLLVPCRDIHTFGMQHSLDVAFVAKDGGVLEVHREVGVRKRLKNRRASMVVERFARTGDWLRVGDVIRLGAPGKDALRGEGAGR